MAKRKTRAAAKTAAIDTTAGASAYALAVEYRSKVEPRLPAGTIDNLAADLTTLGAPPAAPAVAAAAPAAATPAVAATAAPSLSEALATTTNLVTAIHGAIVDGKAKPAVRKAYGVTRRAPVTEPKAVLAHAQAIVTRATAEPSEAVGLGILPEDVTALQAAITALTEAETAAQQGGSKTGGTTAKEKRAASVRMHEATGRIAGAGALAFAQNAAVRAQFEALKAK